MSMLSQRRPSSRRGRSRAVNVTLVVLAMVLLFGAAFAVSTFLRRDGEDSTAGPASTGQPAPCVTVSVTPGAGLPKPAQVKVNVYNATDRTGLARRTAADVTKLGFAVGKIANDPLSRTVTGVAEVRHGPKGVSAARLVALAVPGSVLVADTRTDATVDLVLGAKFSAVATAAVFQAALTSPSPSASGPGCATPTPASASPGGASPASASPASASPGSAVATPAPTPAPTAS